MAADTLPSVGIGLPVYNNSKYLSKTLDSLLNQTYPNIIIYLSDDCSDDGTDDICEYYAAKDKRIKYSRNEKNIGPSANSKKILALASTEYFMFARGHELVSQKLIEECVQVLEQDKSIVVAVGRTFWIDEEDNILLDKPVGYYDTRGLGVAIRCVFALWGNHEYYYGLTKTEIMKNIRLKRDIIGMDFIVMLEMALIGSFAHVGSSTRYRRYHYGNETYGKRMHRYKTVSYRHLRIIDHVFPFARLPYHLFLSVLKSDVSTGDKIKVLLVVLFNAPLRYLVSRGKQL
jgi:glycosyltransferase involved in cell wall biosynthesis